MIEPLQGRPDGTVGFRASGRVTREEHREMLLPAMRIARVREYATRGEALEAAGRAA